MRRPGRASGRASKRFETCPQTNRRPTLLSRGEEQKGAGNRLRLQSYPKASPMRPQCDPNATLKLLQSSHKATPEPVARALARHRPGGDGTLMPRGLCLEIQHDGRKVKRFREQRALPGVAAGILPAVAGGILPPGPALGWRRTAIPPDKMPGSTAGRMPAATGQSGGGNVMRPGATLAELRYLQGFPRLGTSRRL